MASFELVPLGPRNDADGRWCCGGHCGLPCPYGLKIKPRRRARGGGNCLCHRINHDHMWWDHPIENVNLEGTMKSTDSELEGMMKRADQIEQVKPPLTIEGKDNYGHPRQEFADKIAAASEVVFVQMAENRIWLSAYASNNPRSDYHWQADACADEAERRGKPDLYRQAWSRAAATMG